MNDSGTTGIGGGSGSGPVLLKRSASRDAIAPTTGIVQQQTTKTGAVLRANSPQQPMVNNQSDSSSGGGDSSRSGDPPPLLPQQGSPRPANGKLAQAQQAQQRVPSGGVAVNSNAPRTRAMTDSEFALLDPLDDGACFCFRV